MPRPGKGSRLLRRRHPGEAPAPAGGGRGGRLNNFRIREHFLTRLFTLADFRRVLAARTMHDLVSYHADNKLLLMAYNQGELKAMGNIVANRDKRPVGEVLKDYRKHLRTALAKPPRYITGINVLMHALGYFQGRSERAGEGPLPGQPGALPGRQGALERAGERSGLLDRPLRPGVPGPPDLLRPLPAGAGGDHRLRQGAGPLNLQRVDNIRKGRITLPRRDNPHNKGHGLFPKETPGMVEQATFTPHALLALCVLLLLVGLLAYRSIAGTGSEIGLTTEVRVLIISCEAAGCAALIWQATILVRKKGALLLELLDTAPEPGPLHLDKGGRRGERHRHRLRDPQARGLGGRR